MSKEPKKWQWLTPLERRIIAVRYRDGEAIEAIMADFKISRATVHRCADRNRIKRRPWRDSERPVAPPLQEINDIP